MATVLAFSALPAGALLLVGVLSLRWNPNETFRSIILHFAAGVVFSVVAAELLPDIVRRHQPLEVGLGFGLGVLTMVFLRTIERKAVEKEPEKGGYPTAVMTMIGIDLFLDGLLLGIAFQSAETAGILLAISFAIEVSSLGFAIGISLSRMTKRVILGSFILVSAGTLVGAVAGFLAMQNVRGEVVEMALSFGLAALMYLVSEELLVKAHELQETPAMAASFFGGFLVMLLLGMAF